MLIKIGLITMDRNLIRQVRWVIRKFFPDVQVRIEMSAGEDIGTATRRLALWGSEIILFTDIFANHSTFDTIGVPVILIPKQPLDVIVAIRKASKYGNLIGLISHSKVPLQVDLIEELSGVKIKPLTFSDLSDQGTLRETLRKEFQDGLEVVVGGGIITRSVARSCGKHSVVIKYRIETISNIIENARFVALSSRNEKEKNKLIQTIIEFAREGMIVVNKNGMTSYFNPYAGQALGLQEEEVLNQRIEEIIPGYNFNQALIYGKSFTEVINMKEGQLFVNTVPIEIEGTVSCLLIYFKRLKELQEQEIKARQKLHSRGLEAKYNVDHFVSHSAPMQEMIRRIHKFSQTNSTVLITGESGVGKEVVAQSLHNLSQRRYQPFVAVNCSTLQESLLDSELFGYEEGTFTGARIGGKTGLFDLAHKGTIFLDEVHQLSPALQAKILRVLQEKEIRRIGGEKNIPIDIRIIAATNANLTKEVENNTFRKDLYFRLNILSLHVPPLRERLDDLSILVDVILQNLSLKTGKDALTIPFSTAEANARVFLARKRSGIRKFFGKVCSALW